jgi:hypothetical protein
MGSRLGSLLTALAAAASAYAPEPAEVRVDNETWYLQLPSGDLQPIEAVPSTADRKVLTYRVRDMTLSVIVENAHAPATIASCREVFDGRQQGMAQFGLANEVRSQRGDAAIQEHDLTIDDRGQRVAHHDIFSCRVRGFYYIDVHASKTGYRPGDHDALMALVSEVRIVD